MIHLQNCSLIENLLQVDSMDIFKRCINIDKYSLDETYKHLYGHNPNPQHAAEYDAKKILKCAIAIKNQFIQTAESLATKF